MAKARKDIKMKKNAAAKRRPRKTDAALGTGVGVKKSCWTQQEDARLRAVLTSFNFRPGNISWVAIATKMPGRDAKQCRLRWYNNLDPSVKRDAWTDHEKLTLFELQRKLGNKWTDIAKAMFRSEGDVKNRWYTRGFRDLRKALAMSGVERMEQLIVTRQSGFPVDLLSTSVIYSVIFPVGELAEDLPDDNIEQDKIPAETSPRETNTNRKMPPAQYLPCEAKAKSSKQNDGILSKGSSDTETDESLPGDDSIAGLVAPDMARVLPPLGVQPSPSWDLDTSMLGKFDATTLPITSPAYPWPSSLQMFTSPMDSEFECRIDTQYSGGVNIALHQSASLSYFAHV